MIYQGQDSTYFISQTEKKDLILEKYFRVEIVQIILTIPLLTHSLKFCNGLCYRAAHIVRSHLRLSLLTSRKMECETGEIEKLCFVFQQGNQPLFCLIFSFAIKIRTLSWGQKCLSEYLQLENYYLCQQFVHSFFDNPNFQPQPENSKLRWNTPNDNAGFILVTIQSGLCV